MKKILLVDEDAMQASSRKILLERRFSNVERVADATEALCLVEQPQYAAELGLIIAGTHMPGFGGSAFVAELQTRLPHVPILVLGSSGEDMGEYRGSQVRYLADTSEAAEILDHAKRLLDQSDR